MYKEQVNINKKQSAYLVEFLNKKHLNAAIQLVSFAAVIRVCLLYTSPSPRDA